MFLMEDTVRTLDSKKSIDFMPAGILHIEGRKTHKEAYGSKLHSKTVIKRPYTFLNNRDT